ncbi:MAG: hypothetical protein HUJ51_03575 [Eggerthellaceae bacterium]|nr:hypothetical protein [Eggerthellaceae bacterium]
MAETSYGFEHTYEIANVKDVVDSLLSDTEVLCSNLHCKRTKGCQEICIYASN